MTAKRTDANQAEIVDALRAAGCTVVSLHAVGRGVPDLLAGRAGRNYLLEVKTGEGASTPAQRLWRAYWCGQQAVVRSAEEALQAVGLVSKPGAADGLCE